MAHHIFDLFDAAGHRAEINKISFCPSRNDTGQRGFPHSGRPPENHGRDLVPLYELTQHLPPSEQMLLPYKILQTLRPQAACKGSRLPSVVK